MVKIRLRRTGAKKQPSYRIVVADSKAPRDGAFIETIGYYIPKEPVIHVDEEKVLKWLKRGAQPTESVTMLFRQVNIFPKFGSTKKVGEKAEGE